MPTTTVRGGQITNATIQRQDLDTSTVGQAVVAKIVQGSGITLSSTGGDSGTGDVTVTSPDVVSTDAGNIAVLGSDNHILVPQSQIWSVRLRSYNAIGNPAFEVDQRNVGNAVTANGFIQDRWSLAKTGTMAVSCNQVALGGAGYIPISGTNFPITSKVLRTTLTTAQASLGATDQITLYQQLEGVRLRELVGDVHSLSLLVRSSVANLKFGVSIRDNNNTHSLVNLCTLGVANTVTWITLPNLPVFVAGGSWGITPGILGYTLCIALAGGSTITTPTNGTFQNGNFTAANGQDSFAAQAVNSTFDIAFIQHQPGAFCETPIDCPFPQAYDEAQRYYAKSYPYTTAAGATGFAGCIGNYIAANATSLNGGLQWPKPLAKSPTFIGIYNPNTGALNSVWNGASGAAAAVSAASFNEKGMMQLTGSGYTVGVPYAFHYVTDTGW